MRSASRDHRHAAASERLLAAVDVDANLALQHIEGLVYFGVRVQRCGLAPGHDVVKQQKLASCLRTRCEPGVHTTTVEPQFFALALAAYHRKQLAHRHRKPPRMRHGTEVP